MRPGSIHVAESPHHIGDPAAAVLSGNYARIMGIDVAERLERIADDEFSKAKKEGIAPPYSTTRSAGTNE